MVRMSELECSGVIDLIVTGCNEEERKAAGPLLLEDARRVDTERVDVPVQSQALRIGLTEACCLAKTRRDYETYMLGIGKVMVSLLCGGNRRAMNHKRPTDRKAYPHNS